MVIYVKNLWVLESDTDGLFIKSDKKYVVYDPLECTVLYSGNNLKDCVKKAEQYIKILDFVEENINDKNLFAKLNISFFNSKANVEKIQNAFDYPNTINESVIYLINKIEVEE